MPLLVTEMPIFYLTMNDYLSANCNHMDPECPLHLYQSSSLSSFLRFDFDYSFLQKSNPLCASLSSSCSLLPSLAKRYLQQLDKGNVDPRLERGVEMVVVSL